MPKKKKKDQEMEEVGDNLFLFNLLFAKLILPQFTDISQK